MANPNAIVRQICRIDPPLDIHPAGSMGRTVQFSDGQTVRLDPGNPQSNAYGEILEGLRRAGVPAYVEFNPVNRAITRVLVPLVVTVRNIVRPKSGPFLVELEISSARHTLSPTNPQFNRLLTALEEARQRQTQVFVTETDNHEIIDVRPAVMP